MSFWQSYFLWKEAVVAACVMGAACGVVGVYMIVRRVVFLPAALSQVSGFGVILALLLPSLIPAAHDSAWASAEVVAIAVTIAASMLLGWMPEPRQLSRDAVLGIAYILASSLIMIVSDKNPEASHDISNVLFGNAVVVEPNQMFIALGVAALVIVIHTLLMRPFMFVSLDPHTARAHGLAVSRIDAWLFLSVGLTIAVATKTIGAMPVFAFAVLPAAASLMMFSRMRTVFLCAATLGAVSALFGYWISFVWSIPTGPTMAGVTALALIPALVVARLRAEKN